MTGRVIVTHSTDADAVHLGAHTRNRGQAARSSHTGDVAHVAGTPPCLAERSVIVAASGACGTNRSVNFC
jgi:hypothetical protein